MAMRAQIDHKTSRRRTEPDATVDPAKVDSWTSNGKLIEDMDEILDEIDSIIEENAEEFVKNYVQKRME